METEILNINWDEYNEAFDQYTKNITPPQYNRLLSQAPGLNTPRKVHLKESDAYN